jgi:hypothetical protein
MAHYFYLCFSLNENIQLADSSAEAVLNAALILSVTLLWSPDFVSVDFCLLSSSLSRIKA